MWRELWKKFRVLTLALLVGMWGVTLFGCETEPDNGILIEEDNGVDVDVDVDED